MNFLIFMLAVIAAALYAPKVLIMFVVVVFGTMLGILFLSMLLVFAVKELTGQ